MKEIITINATAHSYDIEEVAEKSITVGELIDILNTYDYDSKIVTSTKGNLFGCLNFNVINEICLDD